MRFILIFIIFTLQCFTLSDSQLLDPPPTGSVDPSPNPNPNPNPSPTPSQNPVTSDKPTQPSPDPTTNNPPPTTSQGPNPNPQPTTADNKPQPTTGNNNNTPNPTKTNNNNNNNQPTNNNSNGSQPTNSDSGTTPNNSNPNGPASSGTTDNGSQENSNKGSNSSDDNQNTAKIAGGVVGGIVGLALVGGLLTWLNRHGGCASRTKDRRRHDTYNNFDVNNHQDLESNKMGYHHQDNTSSPHISNSNPMVNNNNNNNSGVSPLSPFQRRLVPATGQTTGYMNLGDDDYSDTSGTLMNQNQPVYPATTQPGIYDYSKTEYNSYEMDAWQHQQQQQQHHHQPQQQYYNTAPSPHMQNMTQMKPDTIDHKPNEI